MGTGLDVDATNFCLFFYEKNYKRPGGGGGVDWENRSIWEVPKQSSYLALTLERS
jgi:hypothetical protein